MNITREQVLARRAGAETHMQESQAQYNTWRGVLLDCDVWLAKLDEPDEEPPVVMASVADAEAEAGVPAAVGEGGA